MSLVHTVELISEASARGGAVLACNAIMLEHAEAIAAAAEITGQAAIIQISQNAVRYHGALAPLAAACLAAAEASSARLALHLDHVHDPDLLRQAPDGGFSSVMFDAGMLPYPQNVAATRAAAAWAHRAGLWLEAELGYVGGKPEAASSAHVAGVRTDPREAVGFVADTGVDALAVAVGSSHAMTSRTARLDHELIAELHAALPVPLVLHGSSGVPDDELHAAVAAGIVKINVGTALNVAFTAAVRECLGGTNSVDPRRYLAEGRAASSAAVARLLEEFAAG